MLWRILKGSLWFIVLIPAIVFYILEQEGLYLDFIHSTVGWTIFFISFISGITLAFGPMMITVWKVLISYFRRKSVLKKGLPAMGRILDIGETKRGIITVNNQPFVSLHILVDDGIRKPYAVEFTTIIPRTAIPLIQAGEDVPIKVDPDNYRGVAIDWERF
jgi:hypothetical protein